MLGFMVSLPTASHGAMKLTVVVRRYPSSIAGQRDPDVPPRRKQGKETIPVIVKWCKGLPPGKKGRETLRCPPPRKRGRETIPVIVKCCKAPPLKAGQRDPEMASLPESGAEKPIL